MKRRGVLLATVAFAAVAVGCSNPLKFVIDNYFRAVNQDDSQTLSSFATVAFDGKVQRWEITNTPQATEAPAPLPDLVQKVQDAEAAVTANKREVRNFNFDHTLEVDQVRELRKADKPIPAKLKDIADTWEQFVEKDRELKRALARAKDAVEKEKTVVLLSVSGVQNVDTLPGTVVTQQLDLALTVDGEKKPYVMTLRKYKLDVEGGYKPMSRWVVTELEPKS